MDSTSERTQSEKKSVAFEPGLTASDFKHEEAVMAVLAENTGKVLESEDADVDTWQGRRIGRMKLPLMVDAKWRKWWDLLVCVILLYVATVSIFVVRGLISHGQLTPSERITPHQRGQPGVCCERHC
mmetsp:Transcript_21623/g.88198  ORF Transcript_21623/g.88198 Transcript_21623/m.88198 type:complete len:127 (+) Transcript_21623:564-944(+)